MDYIGKAIEHKEYGLGTVVEQVGRLITVSFPLHGNKVFRKSVFEKYIMGIEDTNAKEIMAFLRERKIKYLVHFTQFENLNAILNDGLTPRLDLIKSDKESRFNDSTRFDGCTDCSCMSVEYPNIWLLERYRKRNPSSRWAILMLDAELLTNHTNFYARHNAGSNEISGMIRMCSTIEDLREMYTEFFTLHLSSEDRFISRDKLTDFPYLPTSDQAEILVQGRIDQREIRSIIFQSYDDMYLYIGDPRCEKIELLVNDALFDTYRKDYKEFEKR